MINRLVDRKALFAVFVLFAGTVITQPLQAETLDQPVASYPLQCDETFSCPASLFARVGFWVEVFSRWDTNTAIFHDKDNPHRVFTTISRNEGCRNSSRDKTIDRERTNLRSDLQSIANKLQNGGSLNRNEQELYAAFNNSSHQEVRAAADRIRCQSGNSDRMRTALSNFHQYRPAILDALEQQNLTLELQYLPFVESAFNPDALSHVGAAGLWQIMPATGRSLGMRVDSVVDERYDPKLASYGAAKYFRNSVDDLSETAFENGHSVTAKDLNPFVITSYNYGVRGMIRAINQVGLDYERLLSEYQSPNFQTAVKNFYASFLAARHVAKNSQQFFGTIPNAQGVVHSYNQTALPRATSAKRLASELNVSREVLEQLNPSLNNVVWQDKALVPKGFELKLPYRDAGWDNAIASLSNLPAEYEVPGFFWYRVRSGDTACGIASRNGASCRELFQLNGLDRRGTIYLGKSIKVPTNNGGIGTTAPSSSSSLATNSSGSATQSYKVRSGDTACSIANRHTMKCDELLAINGLTRRSIIRVGQTLNVSSGNAWHVVRRGQSACGIAENYRVSCSALLDANRLSRSSVIQVGQRLRIPSQG